MGTQREVGWERQRRMWEVLSPKPAEPLDCLVPWVSKCPFLLMSMWLSFIARRSLMQWGRAHSSIIWQSFVETDNTPGTGQYLCALKGPRHRLKINNKKNCSTRSKTPNYRARLLVNEERPLSHILSLEYTAGSKVLSQADLQCLDLHLTLSEGCHIHNWSKNKEDKIKPALYPWDK